jgi:predicted RNase H-like HicB family nuclease
VVVAKSYVFLAEIVREEDGRWSAGVPSLPGCATWGHTKEEALRNLHDAVEAYIRDVHRAGREIPKHAPTQVRDEPLVAVTV